LIKYLEGLESENQNFKKRLSEGVIGCSLFCLHCLVF